MLNCKDMTKLISDSLDRKLSVRLRIVLWLHISVCGMCRRFRFNIIELRKRIRGSNDLVDLVDYIPAPLPPATKARLEEVVKRELG